MLIIKSKAKLFVKIERKASGLSRENQVPIRGNPVFCLNIKNNNFKKGYDEDDWDCN